jgi:hypothetical protein
VLPRAITSVPVLRRVAAQGVGALVVVALAVTWAWWGGSATSGLTRRLFAAADPVVLLEVAAALVVVGVGVSLAGEKTRRRVVGRASLLSRRFRELSARVPSVVWLAAIVSSAAVVRIALGAANHLPAVLGDELIYSGLAKGWALYGQPVLRGSVELGYSTLYPLFLAPAFRLTADGASALAVIKVMNAIAITSAAVPVYVLARRVLPRSWRLAVAALTVLAPWTAYSALTMTESLFYPAFIAFAAVLAWTLERPAWPRQLAMLAMLAVLIGVRAQGLAVGLGTVVAILLYGALGGATRATLRRFLPTLAVFATLAVVGVAAKAAGVPIPAGTYGTLFDSLSRLGGILKWGAWSIASFGLALGVVALAAFPLALRGMLRGGAPPPVRSTGTVALALSLSLLASVALLSASPHGLGRLHDRSLFYAAPLLLVCLAHWLWRGLERPRRLALGCALAVLALAAALPEDLMLQTTSHDLPSAAFFLALDTQVPGVPFRIWALAIAAVGAGTFLFAKRPLFPVLTVVLAFVAVTTRVDYGDTLSATQARALSWVDHALPPGVNATLVHLGIPYSIEPCASAARREQHELVIWTEYFNTHIDAVNYVYEANMFDGFGHHELTVGTGGLVLEEGRPFQPDYLIIDSRQRITGTQLTRFDLTLVRGASREGASLTLWRVDPPLRFYQLPQPYPPRADGRGC